MKNLGFMVIIGVVGLLIWRAMAGASDRSGGIHELRTSIDGSSLPEQARREMHSLLDKGQLRPSQYLDTSR